jgi:hypothetical protein
LDYSFSEKNPQYVSGGSVSVGEEQLNDAVKASMGLVEWLAKELRARELAFIKQKDA